MNDSVSVIIPTYNRAYCLRQAVDSALGQTHRALDVIVCDDGSEDGTAELVAQLYGHEPRLRYIRQANAGVSAARNRALSEATGDFVAFLDSDDIWTPWKIELQLAAFRAAPEIGMVWTEMAAVGPDGTVIHPRHLHTMYAAYRYFRSEDLFERSVVLDESGAWNDAAGPVDMHVGTIYPQIVMGNLVHTSTVLLARSRLAATGRFDEEMRGGGEDYDFHLRTCRAGPVAFLDISTVRYQIGMPDQLTAGPQAFATNFLRTLTRAVQADGNRLALPPAMQAEVFRYAHAWMADEAVSANRIGDARRHWLKSLSYRPWQPRIHARLALSLLPRPVAQTVRGTCRAARTAWRTARSTQ